MKLKVFLILILIGFTSNQEIFSNTNKEDRPWSIDDNFAVILNKDGDQLGPLSINPGGTPQREIEIGEGTIWSKEGERKLELNFYDDCENVTLTLESNNIVFYKIENINIKKGDSLDINITNFPSGAYTLRGRTINQTTLKGEFTL